MAPRKRAAFVLKETRKKWFPGTARGEIKAMRGRTKLGSVSFILYPKSPTRESQIRIEYMDVESQHRRAGIATKILDNLEKKVDKVVILDMKAGTPLASMLLKRGYTIKRDKEGFWAEKKR
jgi:hypothetical protein